MRLWSGQQKMESEKIAQVDLLMMQVSSTFASLFPASALLSDAGVLGWSCTLRSRADQQMRGKRCASC